MNRQIALSITAAMITATFVFAGCGPKADTTPPPGNGGDEGEATEDEPEPEPEPDPEPEPEPEPEPKVDPKVEALNAKLVEAATGLDWFSIHALIGEGADPAAMKGKKNITDIHIAALEGDLEQVAKLIEDGADVVAETNGSQTPLHLGAMSGNKEVVDLLLEKGAELDHRDWLGSAAVHFAALSGNLELVTYLVEEKKARLKAKKNEDKCTPVLYAVHAGNKEIVELLIKKGASPKDSCEGDTTPLHVAASKDLEDIADYLLKKGNKANFRNEDGMNSLHFLARDCPEGSNCVDLAKLLIKKGAKKADMDGDDMTPFDYAAENNNSELVEVLEL